MELEKSAVPTFMIVSGRSARAPRSPVEESLGGALSAQTP
jgi:hypothetical protein